MKNAKSLCSLYADRVLYYQSDYSREQVRDSKRKLFKKYPTFKQEVSNVRIEQESSRIKTTFEKTVWTSTEEAPKVYPSYLYIELIDGSWKITIESDQVTDENLRKKKG